MAFWTQTDSREPLRQNRWYMSFSNYIEDPAFPENHDLQEFVYALKDVTIPSYSIETTSHVLINRTFNYPKNLVWKPINVTMVSVISDARTLNEAIIRNLEKSGYATKITSPFEARTFDIQEGISKTKASFKSSIIQLDENGLVMQKWDLSNCLISNIEFGSLSYENDGFVDVKLTVAYDYAELAATGITNEQIEKTYQSITLALKEGKLPTDHKGNLVGGFFPARTAEEYLSEVKNSGFFGNLVSNIITKAL